MTVNALLDLICESLEIETGSLSLDTEIAAVDEWNSVGWLTVMSAIDENFNIQLPSKEIRNFKMVQDLVDYIDARASLVK